MKNIIIAFSIFVLGILSCQNDSACLLPNNDCNCPSGYEGDGCGTRVSEKFVGKYKNPSDTTFMIIRDSINLPNRVFITYGSNSLGLNGIRFYGEVDGERIIVPYQVQAISLSSDFPSYIAGEMCINKTNISNVLIAKLTNYFGRVTSQSTFFLRREWTKTN